MPLATCTCYAILSQKFVGIDSVLQQRSTQWVWQFFWLQSLALFVYCIIFEGNMSAVLGALCYLAVQFCFIRGAFRKVGAQHSGAVVKGFYWAEAIKLIFFAYLCYLCLHYLPVSPMIFLGATVVAQSVYFWGACLLNRASGICYE